jgi:hypothetical protein
MSSQGCLAHDRELSQEPGHGRDLAIAACRDALPLPAGRAAVTCQSPPSPPAAMRCRRLPPAGARCCRQPERPVAACREAPPLPAGACRACRAEAPLASII